MQYPVYAINRTMFFTYEWFRFWDSGILCENAVVALNLYTISWSNLHSLCEVVCSCKAMQSEQNKQRICKSSHKFETSNCNTLSMRARVGTSYLWVPVNLAQCRSKESVFHLMLQNSCTKYWPKIVKQWMANNFGCRALYNLPWPASVNSHQVKCNISTFETLLWKDIHLILERCRKNVWLRALMQSDC